jgi:hypothetical protein
MKINYFIDKINIGVIVKKHLKTLVNANTDKAGTSDIITFLIFPIIVSIVLSYLHVELSDTVINIIIVSLSIFVGLLFNLIILIFDIVKGNTKNKIKNEILEQLLVNIAFTVLLSIVAIVFTLFTFVQHHMYIKLVFTGIVYFMLTLFLATILMILKRMYILFENEIKDITNEKK